MPQDTLNGTALCMYNTPAEILQTEFSANKGNALQACVAAIFHLDLDRVPNFVSMADYEQGIRDFLSSSCFSMQKIKDVQSVETGKLGILRGKSPRGDFGHVIVARKLQEGFENLWDPHPDGSFLDSTEGPGWFMVFELNC